MCETTNAGQRPPPLVCVADDDAAVLKSLRFLLETDGLAVRTFKNGTALLNAAPDAHADCFVIDYKMPDINGIDLAGRLKQSRVTAPVILITGALDDKLSARAAAAGLNEVVSKPLLDDNLLKRIRFVLGDRNPASGILPR